jgi:hypothetical protein
MARTPAKPSTRWPPCCRPSPWPRRRGPALLRAEDVWQREPAERAAYRAALHDVALAAKVDSERPPDERVISPEVADAMLGATTEAGEGSNPTRTWVLGETITGNVTAALVLGASVGAATLGLASFGPAGAVAGVAVGLLFGKGLEQSKPFIAARGALTQLFDQAMKLDAYPAAALLGRRLGAIGRLVAGTGPRLRRLGEMGGALSWVSRSLEWLAARPAAPGIGPQPDGFVPANAKHTSATVAPQHEPDWEDVRFWEDFGKAPPAGFSIDEVKRLIRAGERLQRAWVPFIRELDFSRDWRAAMKPGESFLEVRNRLWAEPGTSALRSAEPLGQLTNLRSLSLEATGVADLAPLARLSALRHLNLSVTQITDLTALADLSSLQSLHLWGTKVAKLGPLAKLTALQVLDLQGTEVEDVTALAHLANLRFLDLRDTKVTNLCALARLTSLQDLNLWNTKIESLTHLAGLSALKFLNLWGTMVADLTPLADLSALQFLNLGGTNVTDLSPLAGLVALQTIHLRSAPVFDLTPLADLPNLQELDLSGLRYGIEAVLPRRAEIKITRR